MFQNRHFLNVINTCPHICCLLAPLNLQPDWSGGQKNKNKEPSVPQCFSEKCNISNFPVAKKWSQFCPPCHCFPKENMQWRLTNE